MIFLQSGYVLPLVSSNISCEPQKHVVFKFEVITIPIALTACFESFFGRCLQ